MKGRRQYCFFTSTTMTCVFPPFVWGGADRSGSFWLICNITDHRSRIIIMALTNNHPGPSPANFCIHIIICQVDLLSQGVSGRDDWPPPPRPSFTTDWKEHLEIAYYLPPLVLPWNDLKHNISAVVVKCPVAISRTITDDKWTFFLSKVRFTSGKFCLPFSIDQCVDVEIQRASCNWMRLKILIPT